MPLVRRIAAPILAAVAVAAVAGACAGDPSAPSGAPPRIATLPRALTGPELTVITASNNFSSALLRAVNSSRALDSNVFISPLSATMALGMTMNGAAGTTFDEMRATLGFGALPREEILRSYRDLIALLRGLDSRVDFRIANAIWTATRFAASVDPAFLDESQDYFGAQVASLDFSSPEALTTINGWVKEGTNGKIERILDAIDPALVMILGNAIYFKGDWRDAFPKTATKNAPFTTARDETVQVPMMTRVGAARVGGARGRTAVEAGYGGDAFAMTIILPAEGETVDQLVTALTPEEWDAQVASLRESEVDLSMPKFKLAWEDELNDELISMGMPTAFIAGQADFTRLSPSAGRDIYIDFVKQKTFVDVNEVGTEAAAVTVVGIREVSLPQRETVHVDRPFVFAIRERLSGTILFVGKIVDPTR
jgi:serpin B